MNKDALPEEMTNWVVCPVSPGLFSAPALISGATIHVIGFVNALAARSDTKTRLLYPRTADLSEFSDSVEVVLLDMPGILEWPLPRVVRLLVWNLLTLLWGFRAAAGRWWGGKSPDALYVRFSASVALSWVLLKILFPSILFLVEVNTPASISAVNQGAIARWLSRWVDRLTLMACDGAMVVSEDLKTILIEQHGDRIRRKLFVNASGVDLDRFRPLEDPEDRQSVLAYRHSLGIGADSCVIGYVGKALPHHRLDIVARLVGEIRDVPLKLLIAGNLDTVSAESLIEAGEGAVLPLGQIPFARVPLFLNACDILVLPHGPSYGNRLHQSPIKLFEYLAVGKPVVASRIGQIARVITHGENGLLFDPGDCAQLQDHLKRLAGDGELRHRLGVAARRTVENDHTWDANAKRVVTAFGALRRMDDRRS